MNAATDPILEVAYHQRVSVGMAEFRQTGNHQEPDKQRQEEHGRGAQAYDGYTGDLSYGHEPCSAMVFAVGNS